MLHGETRITQYVEAVRECRALRRALDEEGPSPERNSAFVKATVAVRNAEALLNGSQLGAAKRRLAGL